MTQETDDLQRKIVMLIRAEEERYAGEVAALRGRVKNRHSPGWDEYAHAVHKRSMARVLSLRIERGDHLLTTTIEGASP